MSDHRPQFPLQRLFWAVLLAATLLLFGTLAGCAPTSSNSNTPPAPVCTPSAAGSATDCDGDGIANATDAFPTDACAALDSDGDGQPDTLILPDAADDDACTTASSLTADAFPTDACAALDSDGDGQPDTLTLPADDSDDACTTASSLTADSEPLIPALLALNTTMSYTASAAVGEHRFRLTIANPVADAYKIGILETGSDADDNAANVTALSATTTSAINDRTDHTTRLRRGGLTPITNPIVADGSNVGVVYTFLPGDDAAAATPDFSMLWGSYPNGAGQLAASLTYTIAVRATAGTTYSLRVEKVTELARLPSNIRTRARRGMCGSQMPIPVEDDSVSCNEGGLSVGGQGYYLIYSPVVGQLRVKLNRVEIDSTERRFFDTTPDDANDDDGDGSIDDDGDGLVDTTTLTLRVREGCVSSGPLIFRLIYLSADPIEIIEESPLLLPASEQIYCLQILGASDSSNVASDNLQFTLYPRP